MQKNRTFCANGGRDVAGQTEAMGVLGSNEEHVGSVWSEATHNK